MHAGVYLDFSPGLRSLRGWPCQRGRSKFKCDTNVHCVNLKQYMKYRQPLGKYFFLKCRPRPIPWLNRYRIITMAYTVV